MIAGNRMMLSTIIFLCELNMRDNIRESIPVLPGTAEGFHVTGSYGGVPDVTDDVRAGKPDVILRDINIRA